MKNHYLILLILLLILLSCNNILGEGFLITVKSSTNLKNYLMQEYPNHNKAAEILGKLDDNINKFANNLLDKYPNDKRIIRLVNNLEDTKYEEAPHVNGESTYTLNKGELIKICLRKKKDGKPIHNLNTLMFVVIHELAHVMSISIGHNKEFMDNFRFLLREADDIDIDYTPIDYSKENMTYCGVDVTHNPYYNNV
jgi:hypothetical protein